MVVMTLDITAHGTGDTTFRGAVGDSTALGDITIDTNDLTAAAITAGNLNVTHSGAGAVTGIIANASELDTLALIKAGVGTLTLSAVNTFTGDTTISAGDVVIGRFRSTRQWQLRWGDLDCQWFKFKLRFISEPNSLWCDQWQW